MLELFFFSYRKYEQNLFTKKKKGNFGEEEDDPCKRDLCRIQVSVWMLDRLAVVIMK